MNKLGPKRPASDDAAKAKRGRPKKKPNYNREQVIDDLIMKAADLFEEPYDDRQERSPDAPTIVYVAEEMHTTTLRVRRMLITAGYYSTELSRRVQALYGKGYTIPQIMEETGLQRASVNGYLPYIKGAYKLDDPTIYATQSRSYRLRKEACFELKHHLNETDAEDYLWKAIEAFEGYPFETANGLPMQYRLKGGELFFSRKEKSITKATVMKAFHTAREVQKAEGHVSGPKKLKTFGASYLYAVFLRIGVCEKKAENA